MKLFLTTVFTMVFFVANSQCVSNAGLIDYYQNDPTDSPIIDVVNNTTATGDDEINYFFEICHTFNGVQNCYTQYTDNDPYTSFQASPGLYQVRRAAYIIGCIDTLKTPVMGITKTESLPVELTDFDAYPEEGKNVLVWTTESEEDFDSFEVQKSRDGVNFMTFKEVHGKGYGDYQTDDKNLFQETYYRLKMVDYDGTFEYSDIIYLRRMKEAPAKYMRIQQGFSLEGYVFALNGAYLSNNTKTLKPGSYFLMRSVDAIRIFVHK